MGYILPETGDGRVQNLIVPVSPSYESSIPDWGSESFSFQSYGFMPTEQPYISKAQEKVTTVTLPGVHGSLIQPVFLDATNTHKNWEARTGSLDFYYVKAVPAQDAYDEEVAFMRYIKYTAEELAKKKAEKEKQEERQKAVDTLPETLAALQSAQNDTDSLMVDQEYRLTLLELGVTPET